MPNIWTSDQVNQILSIGGTAVAGLGGAPNTPRATEVRGILKVYRFTFSQAAGNPMPGNTPGPIVTGDSVIIALLPPTERIYMGRIFNNAWGGSVTVKAGKIDPNNSANTDLAHYMAATSIVGAGGPTEFNLNMTEQVGVDPLGDQSVGNAIPEFGSQNIQIVLTFGGTFATLGTMYGFLMVVEEGN